MKIDSSPSQSFYQNMVTKQLQKQRHTWLYPSNSWKSNERYRFLRTSQLFYVPPFVKNPLCQYLFFPKNSVINTTERLRLVSGIKHFKVKTCKCIDRPAVHFQKMKWGFIFAFRHHPRN